MGYFLSLCAPNPSWVFTDKKLIIIIFFPFEVPVVSDNWICWSLFLEERGQFHFFVDRNFFIIALMVEMEIFTALALFLKPYIFCELF